MMTLLERLRKSWIVTDVLLPFLLTRALLVLVGILVQVLALPISPEYPIQHVVADRWHFTPYFLVDMWMRWDTGWYFRVASIGYTDTAGLGSNYSSLAFFPLYPGVIRGLLTVLGAEITATSFGLAGMLVSNLSLLAGLGGLHRLTREALGDQTIGRRAVWWMLVFPSAFYFSALYTEPLWFACTVFSLLAAERKQWWLAAILGVFATLARVQGFLILLPLGWLYMAERNWDFRRLDRHLIWLSLPGLALIGWFAALYPLTGSWIAPITAQTGWGRSFGWPWQSLFAPVADLGAITRLEQIFLTLGLALCIWEVWRAIKYTPGALSPAYTVYGVALLVLPLLTGVTISGLRHVVVVFPLYMIAAGWRGSMWAKRGAGAVLLALQLVLFGGWCLFYWIG